MDYKTIHTLAGLAALAAADATGVPINLTHMAVGDGNGNAVTPSESQTVLVREMYRSTINRVYQDSSDTTLFWAELVVPASAGGFTMREVGVFNADGSLFLVGNLPATYKPQASEGSFSDTVVRVGFKAGNSGVITIVADPAVATASQAWVLNNITVCHLLPGGTTHQVLRKKSNACGDTEWADPTDVNVTVSSIEETQTLAAAQTVVNWTTVNNEGLAVYIEGVRLRADQFTKHATINTRITLASSYPAGTKIVGTQNEPAGTLTDPLAKNQNLSDVPDKATARANLGVYSKSEVDQRTPVGVVDHYAASTPPAGWLVRDGSAISRTAYSALFAVIGTTFGAGDGFNTFNVPDDRELFDRGWGGVSSGRAFGSYQADDLKSHSHSYLLGGTRINEQGGNQTDSSDGNRGIPTMTTGATGGTETRPKNRAYLPIIKY